MPTPEYIRAAILDRLALYPEGLRRLKLCVILNGLHQPAAVADFEPVLADLVAEGLVRVERPPVNPRGRPPRTYFLVRRDEEQAPAAPPAAIPYGLGPATPPPPPPPTPPCARCRLPIDGTPARDRLRRPYHPDCLLAERKAS